MNRKTIVTAITAAAAALVTAPAAASAIVPPARSFSDLATMFPDTSCVGANGRVLGADLIVNPGGGNVAWLPDGTHLVGTSFTMYDAYGNRLLTKNYGGPQRRSTSDVTCTSSGVDPDTGAPVTIVFAAVTTS